MGINGVSAFQSPRTVRDDDMCCASEIIVHGHSPSANVTDPSSEGREHSQTRFRGGSPRRRRPLLRLCLLHNHAVGGNGEHGNGALFFDVFPPGDHVDAFVFNKGHA